MSKASPVTAVVYLDVGDKEIQNETTKDGRTWTEIQRILDGSIGFIEQYWGRSPEHSSKVRLHIARESLEDHAKFRASQAGQRFHELFQALSDDEIPPLIRYVLLEDFSRGEGTLARHAPITGTAFYPNSTEVWDSYAWPLWTHIVRHAPGNRGVAGGKVIDEQGNSIGYLVYVGWDSDESHQEFRKSPACADRRVILTLGHDGQSEYCNIVFDRS